MGNKVRIGMIGLGARGKGLLETAYLEHPDAEFVVVCDKYEDRSGSCDFKFCGSRRKITRSI